jgi:hypothetical protein
MSQRCKIKGPAGARAGRWLLAAGWMFATAEAPAVRGRFEMGHGPQRIPLPEPVGVHKLILKFTSSHGGPNPGASEIQVYGASPPADALARFRPLPPGRPERVDERIMDSEELTAELADGRLGFEQLVVIQRQELNPSHVYTYHVEGFGPGGGLYVLDAAALARARRAAHGTSGRDGFQPVPDSAVRGLESSASNNAGFPEGPMPDARAFLRELVASPEGQILDCDVSQDGREILFSWRRTRMEATRSMWSMPTAADCGN